MMYKTLRYRITFVLYTLKLHLYTPIGWKPINNYDNYQAISMLIFMCTLFSVLGILKYVGVYVLSHQ